MAKERFFVKSWVFAAMGRGEYTPALTSKFGEKKTVFLAPVSNVVVSQFRFEG